MFKLPPEQLEVIAWLDSAEGREWSHAKFQINVYSWFQLIPDDEMGEHIAFHQDWDHDGNDIDDPWTSDGLVLEYRRSRSEDLVLGLL